EKVGGILGAMVEGVVVISATGEVILMNQRAERIFGLPSGSDARGRPLIEACRDPELQELLRDTAASGERAAVPEIRPAGGGRRHVGVGVAPLGGAHQGGGFVLVFHDITELKRLETIRRDFVANVSHELRTPLTAIRGYAETLLGGALDERERARRFLGVI